MYRGLHGQGECHAFQDWNALLLSHIRSHTQLGYVSYYGDTQGDAPYSISCCRYLLIWYYHIDCSRKLLILYIILVPAVHQLLVWQRLFRRWTQSTLNRRLLGKEPAVRVSTLPLSPPILDLDVGSACLRCTSSLRFSLFSFATFLVIPRLPKLAWVNCYE
jgi:hypothetical protein